MMKRPRVILILAVIFLLTGAAAPLHAQGKDVRGYVKGADGNPKISASVKLTGPGNYIALTNARGEFFLGKVNPGTYKVTVLQGNNYQEFTRNIQGGTLGLMVNW
jgi:hypothetical protein